jgi:hypothetical protein
MPTTAEDIDCAKEADDLAGSLDALVKQIKDYRQPATFTDAATVGRAADCLRKLAAIVRGGEEEEEPVTTESLRGWAAKVDRAIMEGRLKEARVLNRAGPSGKDGPPTDPKKLQEWLADKEPASGKRLSESRRQALKRTRGVPPGGFKNAGEFAAWASK